MSMQSQPTRVLIAEDNYDLQIVFVRVFAKMSFDVMLARNGQEALEMIGQAIPDVVVLDVNMPFVSGLDVLSYLRQQKDTQNLKVILVTGNCVAQHTPEADLADLFLLKPVNPKELVTMVQRLLAQQVTA
jgi:CheY-like chemotaxis protein